MITIAQALRSLRPLAVYSVNGDTYQGIDWLDETYDQPTEQEVIDEVARLEALEITEDEAAPRRAQAIEAANALVIKQMVLDENLSDDERLSIIGFYPLWTSGLSVSVDDLYRYDVGLYRCVQAHTTQEDWEPPNVPALWTSVVTPGTIGAWVQPTGGHDAYPLDALVTHNGQTWISLVANNVWEPGTVGTESLWAVYSG